MASATNYFDAYRIAQEAFVGLKLAILEVVDGHDKGIEACDVARILGMYRSQQGCSPFDVVEATLRIMETEGTIFFKEKLWKVVDIT